VSIILKMRYNYFEEKGLGIFSVDKIATDVNRKNAKKCQFVLL